MRVHGVLFRDRWAHLLHVGIKTETRRFSSDVEAGDLLYVKLCHALALRRYDDDLAGYDDDLDGEGAEPTCREAEFAYFRATPRVGVRRWIGSTAPPTDAFQGRPHDMTYLHETSPLESGPAAKVKKWRPSIFMPKWAARTFLLTRSVHTERLLDIDEAGAVAEGVGSVAEYLALWDDLNAHTAGAAVADNPVVKVIRFTAVRRPDRWPEAA